MKIEVIKNKFFDLESVLKGERKNIYNKDAYAFLECKDDKDNIARFFDLGEIALNYNQENNQIEVYFLKYDKFSIWCWSRKAKKIFIAFLWANWQNKEY